MCFADKISGRPAGVQIERAGRTWIMPDSSSFAPIVQEAEAHYLLLPEVTEACRKISGEWDDLLVPANPRLRAPMKNLWIEWRDPVARQEVGVLVDAADDGRSGILRIFWDSARGVEAAQGEIVFDFDRPVHFRAPDSRTLFPLQGLPPCLGDLQPHMALAFDECWMEYFRASPLGPSALSRAVEQSGRQLWSDAINALAFFALVAVRVPLNERQVDRRKLNVARAKSGKPALLDHVELALGRPERSGANDNAQGGLRRNPRLHVVRGHLVRRRDNIFWRTAHMRGLKNAQQAMPKKRFVRMYSD